MAEYWRLKPRERRVLHALADTVLPRGGAFELGALDIELDGPFERYLRGMNRLYAKAYRAHLRVFDYGPLLFWFKPRRFTSLGPEEREQFCKKLEGHKRFGGRMFLFLLKFLIAFISFSDPRLERAAGYEPHCPDEEDGG
ncbi:MAG: hypothetical protein P9M14_04620 [Candidatus Alcyoniella australis]|nr:hypothetical protein [Candidatus Alcyoniella australis]